MTTLSPRSSRPPVYTDPAAQCGDCHLCISHCPVNAIAMRGGQASIQSSDCVGCGQCVQSCPRRYQRVRTDVERVRDLLTRGEQVVISLSPAWVGEFPGVTPSGFLAALHALGFHRVSELAHGAELFLREAAQRVTQRTPGVCLLPACPAVTTIMLKAWPHWTESILPVASPLVAHARLLKELYGPRVRVVAIGPCVAQKVEADATPDLITAVLTFTELRSWMLDNGVDPQVLSQRVGHSAPDWLPGPAPMGHQLVNAGGLAEAIKGYLPPGMLNTTQLLHYSGPEAIHEALTGLEAWGEHRGMLVLELMACGGGCVNGPGASHLHALPFRQLAVRDLADQREHFPPTELPPVDLLWHYRAQGRGVCKVYSAHEIAAQLEKIDCDARERQTDCGACGYPTCQSFAIALCQGKAEPAMCTPYQRRVATLQLRMLLAHMPSGVVFIDAGLRILEANWSMARMLGSSAQVAYDTTPALKGLDSRDYFPCHRLFESVLRTGEQIVDREEPIRGRLLKISIFTIVPHQLVCAIARDLFQTDVRGDEVVNRTRELIARNLETVQKIAFLLGESASYTESELNAIIQTFTSTPE